MPVGRITKVAKSFRLNPELEGRLAQAARAEHVAVSDFIRQAVRERCDRVLDRTLRDELSDVIGAVGISLAPGGAPQIAEPRQPPLSERTGEAFKELLLKRAGR
jgi:hypothetical protein